jgi:hypothetical protein
VFLVVEVVQDEKVTLVGDDLVVGLLDVSEDRAVGVDGEVGVVEDNLETVFDGVKNTLVLELLEELVFLLQTKLV